MPIICTECGGIKLLKDLKELAEYDQSTSTDRPIFLNDNEDHPVQNKEPPKNSSEETVVSKTNQEPPQNLDVHQLIEECFVEGPEEQKQNTEKTMHDLVKICHHKQFLFMHDNVDDLIESALDSKLLSIKSINSQLAPILSTKEPENSLSIGYEHLSITPETKSDEVTESNAKNLLPIPSECEVTLEDKRECDQLICENSSTVDVCDNHSEILFDSNNDDLSSDDESFEDIDYVDASVPDPRIVSVEENVDHQEQEEINLEEISQVQDIVLREKLISITRLISNIESLNDNSTPDRVFNSFEYNNSLLDNFLPKFETFYDHTEETRKPLDDNFYLEPKVISAVMEDIDEPDEHFNPGGEIFVSTNIEDVDYFPFMFVIRIFLPYLILHEISPLFLSAESEDTIFDPAKALPTNDARVVVKFLKSLFSRFGTPKAIINDRGTYFCNDQFSRVMAKYGVTHRLSTAYHPQTSGQVEVTNRGLKRILERTVGENRASWSDKLEDVLWAFRTAYKTSIGCTSHRLAYENSLIYKERTKKLHDDKIKNRIFNVGDQVLLFNSRLKIFSGKLKSCWSGPFTISEIYPYGTAKLIHPDGCNFKVNCHRLKHYHGGDLPPLEIPDVTTFPKDN
nr:reverse transcriptase domain-containing protein [Tanacetum cinerariifolium]